MVTCMYIIARDYHNGKCGHRLSRFRGFASNGTGCAFNLPLGDGTAITAVFEKSRLM